MLTLEEREELGDALGLAESEKEGEIDRLKLEGELGDKDELLLGEILGETEAERLTLGENDELILGLRLGLKLGDIDNEILGDIDGDNEELGLAEGLKEGDNDGLRLGEKDGLRLGEMLNEIDGLTEDDGEADGEIDGETDGLVDGLKLGLFEKLNDGEELGLRLAEVLILGLTEAERDTQGIFSYILNFISQLPIAAVRVSKKFPECVGELSSAIINRPLSQSVYITNT